MFKETRTVPVRINIEQEKLIVEIMKKYPVFRFDTNNFNARCLKIGVDIILNGNKSATEALLNEVKDLWLPEIVALGRWYNKGKGYIPYKFYPSPYGKKIPKIRKPKTGIIMTYYDSVSGDVKYIFISNFQHENTAELKYGMFMQKIKYDPKTHIFVVPGKSPDQDGEFNSDISFLIPQYKDVKEYGYLTKKRDRKIVCDPMVIEEIVPTNMEQLKFIGGANKMVLNEQSEEDLRQENPVIDSNNKDRNRNRNVVRNYHYYDNYEQRDGPYQKDMLIKLLPGQKFHEYKVQDLQSKYDLKKEDFERELSTTLGTVFKPWERDPHRTVSDAYLVSAQLFTVTATDNELSVYEKLVTEWIMRLYGEPFLALYKNIEFAKKKGDQSQKISFGGGGKIRGNGNGNGNGNEHLAYTRKSRRNNPRFRPQTQTQNKQFKRRRVEPDFNLGRAQKRRKIIGRKTTTQRRRNRYKRIGKILNDKEILFLKGIIDLKVEFTRKPTIVRPGFEELERLFYSGAIDGKKFSNIYSDIFGTRLKNNINQKDLFIGTSKANGMWTDEKSLDEELKVQHNLSKQMMQGQGQGRMGQGNMQRTRPKPQKGGGGGGGRRGGQQQRRNGNRNRLSIRGRKID